MLILPLSPQLSSFPVELPIVHPYNYPSSLSSSTHPCSSYTSITIPIRPNSIRPLSPPRCVARKVPSNIYKIVSVIATQTRSPRNTNAIASRRKRDTNASQQNPNNPFPPKGRPRGEPFKRGPEAKPQKGGPEAAPPKGEYRGGEAPSVATQRWFFWPGLNSPPLDRAKKTTAP